MSKDLQHNITEKYSILIDQYTDDKTDGTIVDLAGAEACRVLIPVAAVGAGDSSNYFTIKVEVGDNADLSDAADLAATDYIEPVNGAGEAWANRRINATAMANTLLSFGFLSQGKRYARVVAVETSTADATFGAIIQKGTLRNTVFGS